jgi:hypothetical protein
MLKVFKSIPATSLGSKSFGQGDVALLKDFQFNAWIQLHSLLHKLPSVSLETSGLNISLQESACDSLFKQVAKARNVVLQLLVYNVSLDGHEDQVIPIKDMAIPTDLEYFRGAKLQVPLNLKGERVVFVALGIHNLNERYIIGNRTTKAAAIIFSVRLKDGIEVVFVPSAKEIVPSTVDNGVLDWEMQ